MMIRTAQIPLWISHKGDTPRTAFRIRDDISWNQLRESARTLCNVLSSRQWFCAMLERLLIIASRVLPGIDLIKKTIFILLAPMLVRLISGHVPAFFCVLK
jgi:hypothetical protein